MTFEEFLEEWRSEDAFISVRTSGSTGTPKHIRLAKEFARRSALRTNRYFGIDSTSHLHSCVAADYIGGKMMAVRGEVAGCRFTWEPPSNRPLAGMTDRIDLLSVVPSQMLHILDNVDSLPEIGAILVGGSAINPGLYARIARSGLNAYETYGMTETASHIAVRKIEEGSIWFEAFPGVEVSTDDRGCLVIDFGSGERVVSNDLATLGGERLFRIEGRIDHVIVTGGKKVNPLDVENRIGHLISAPFVITSEPDMKWGQMIVLKVEEEMPDEKEKEKLKSSFRQLLEPHEMPKKIEWVKSLPRTGNGKIKR